VRKENPEKRENCKVFEFFEKRLFILLGKYLELVKR
jgi:hypothetical protein